MGKHRMDRGGNSQKQQLTSAVTGAWVPVTFFYPTCRGILSAKGDDVLNDKPTAWMLRRDGTAFPCVCHFYGSADDIHETLYAAEWLYDATGDEKTRELISELIRTYGASLNRHRNWARNIVAEIKQTPYVFLTRDFVMRLASLPGSGDGRQISALNRAVIRALDAEFTRARLGGMYDTVSGNRDLYFRVSGKGSWVLTTVRIFTEAHSADADTVTVMWDPESTGRDDILKDDNGRVLDRVPTKEFLQ